MDLIHPRFATRRSVIAGLSASAATLAGCAPQRPQASNDIRLQLSWLKTVQFGGFWLADRRGYYRSYGLAPTWLSGGPAIAATPPLVAGGQADLGIDQFVTVIDAVVQGCDMVALGSVCQENPGGLLSLPHNPITRARDIVGKRIGVMGSAKPTIDALLQINGLPVDYTPVPVGFDPTPLIEGACDGYVCFVTSQPIELKLKGIPYVTATYGQLGMPSYADTLYANRSYIKANRRQLVNYLTATLRGWNDFLRAPRDAVELTLSSYGRGLDLNPVLETAYATEIVPFIAVKGTRLLSMSKELVAGPIYEFCRLTGRGNLPPVDRLVDLSLLEEARARL